MGLLLSENSFQVVTDDIKLACTLVSVVRACPFLGVALVLCVFKVLSLLPDTEDYPGMKNHAEAGESRVQDHHGLQKLRLSILNRKKEDRKSFYKLLGCHRGTKFGDT